MSRAVSNLLLAIERVNSLAVNNPELCRRCVGSIPGSHAYLLRLLQFAAVLLIAGLHLKATAESFFPIGVWLQDSTNAAKYRAAGINTYVGLWEGPTAQQLADLQSAGMRVICFQNETALQHPTVTNIIAWMHNDEPDNSRLRGARLGIGSPTSPAKVVTDYQALKKIDPTRPVFLNLGQGVAWDNWYGRGRRNRHPEDYPEYLKGCDIASFDIYPANHGHAEVAGNLWFVADGITRLRRWGNDQKPVWNCIETTRIDDDGRKPTPHEVRAEVWMSLIHGSRGIIYFVHQFKPTFIEAALLADPEMLAAVTKLNEQITSLAPVLNSPTVSNVVTIRSTNTAAPVVTMVKVLEEFTYVFAVMMRPLETKAEFALQDFPGSGTVEVLGESRSLQMTDGKFSDRFGPWDVHLYRLKANLLQ